MKFEDWLQESKKIDYKKTMNRLKKICKSYVGLLPKKKGGKLNAKEMELMAELERCYNLLPEDYRIMLSNWIEPKITAKTDIAVYVEMGLDEKDFYRQRRKAIIEFALLLGVEVYEQ